LSSSTVESFFSLFLSLVQQTPDISAICFFFCTFIKNISGKRIQESLLYYNCAFQRTTSPDGGAERPLKMAAGGGGRRRLVAARVALIKLPFLTILCFNKSLFQFY